MPVTDEQVVWLRAYLSGELEAAQKVSAHVAGPGAAAGLGALVYAAFVVSARRTFAPRWSRAEVTRYVTQVRRLLSDQPGALDPAVAEQELRSALGEKLTSHPGAKSRGRAQFILLNALVQSLGLNDAELTDLLYQARGIADSLLADSTGSGSKSGNS